MTDVWQDNQCWLKSPSLPCKQPVFAWAIFCNIVLKIKFQPIACQIKMLITDWLLFCLVSSQFLAFPTFWQAFLTCSHDKVQAHSLNMATEIYVFIVEQLAHLCASSTKSSKFTIVSKNACNLLFVVLYCCSKIIFNCIQSGGTF